jgi:uncharacterized protein (TIGR04222 family)
LSEDAELNVYQIAYVCGGPARVAMVALVGLYEDGQVKIARARHRVTVLVHDQSDPVRAAVVESIPDSGRMLGPVLAAAAGSGAVAEVRRTLRDRGLLPGSRITGLWPSPRFRAALSLRRRLVAGLPAEADDPRRVATMGSAGIGDPTLRQIFETPDPEFTVPSVRPPGVPEDNSGHGFPYRSGDFTGFDSSSGF